MVDEKGNRRQRDAVAIAHSVEEREGVAEIVIGPDTEYWSGNSTEREDGVSESYIVYHPEGFPCVWLFHESYRAENGNPMTRESVWVEQPGASKLLPEEKSGFTIRFEPNK